MTHIDNYTNTTVNYTYDDYGEVSQIAEGTSTDNNVVVSTTKDADRKVTSKVTTLGLNHGSATVKNEYTYDSFKLDPRLVQEKVFVGSNRKLTKEYNQDAFGRLLSTTLTTSNNVALTNSFDYRVWDNGTRLTNRVQKVTYADGTYDEYEYNTNNTIKRVTGSNPTVSYTYDTLHRLTKEINLALGKTFDYTYDKNGNILSKTVDGVTTNYQYDTTVKDRLVQVGNQSIEYDAVGNPIYYLGNSLSWTRGRLLSSFGSTFFTYNSAGMRASKTVGISTTNYGLVGSTIVSEQTGNTKHYYYHSANGVVGFSRRVGDTTTDYYYRKNLQGDVVALLDASGNVVAKYVYDAWGNHRIYDSANTIVYDSTNPSAYSVYTTHIGCLNPFRYRGY